MITVESSVGLLNSLREPTLELRKHIPNAWNAFSELQSSAMAGGLISRCVKEMTAVAIAVANGCEGCIAYHARAAVRHGAQPNEMAEMLSVALLMGGGPASVYAPIAWSAFCEFYEVHEELRRAATTNVKASASAT